MTDPDAAKPDAAKPDAAKSDAAKPDAAKPDAAKPDAAKSDAAKPDAAKPDESCTARLMLEPLRAEHAALLFPLLADPRLYVYVDDKARTTVARLAERFAELARGAPAGSNETWLNWVILRRADGAALGTLQATLVAGERAWIGYLLTPATWGQGYATEACTWLVARLARRHGVRDILASVDTRNAKSIALLGRLGFTRAATCAAELHGQASVDHRYRLSVAV